MDIRPTVPAVMGADDGAVTVFSSKYARNIVLTAAAQLEMDGLGLLNWAKSSNDRLDSFYEKIFPKVITKELVVDDRRSVEDIIDAIDGTPSSGEHVTEEAIDAEFDERDYG